MVQPDKSQMVAADFILLVFGTLFVRVFPEWWAGRTAITPERPPDSWFASAGLWRRFSYEILPLMLALITGALSMLAALVSTTLSVILIVIAALLAVVWSARWPSPDPASWSPRAGAPDTSATWQREARAGEQRWGPSG